MRAVARWGWRITRRDWRQQVLVTALLSVAVAGATFLAAVVYNSTGALDERLGYANQAIMFSGADPAATAADVAAAREAFGTVDVLETWEQRVAASVDRVEVRRLDPHGEYIGATVAVADGRYPTQPGEIAVSRGLARQLGLNVGDELPFDDETRTIVGMVENPAALGDEFAVVADPPNRPPDRVSILTVADEADVVRFSDQASDSEIGRMSSGDQDETGGVLLSFAISTVALLMVALIAATSFIVVGQRRMRYFGLLAAVGATERQVRTVTLVGGALVGLAAATFGLALGIGAWVTAQSWVETLVRHRISGLNLPVWLLATSAILAILTALAASWWPARALARIPITQALSGRPPRPAAAHRSAIVGLTLVVVGIACLALADQRRVWLIIIGMLATPIGVLVLAPLAVRTVGRAATGLPVAARLAVRDLARHQSRSGAALAAISLAVGIQASIVIVAAISENDVEEGNLAASQLIFHLGDDPEPFSVAQRSATDLAEIDSEVESFAESLGGATVAPIDLAVDPTATGKPGIAPPGEDAAVVIGRAEGPDSWSGHVVVVATPALMDALGGDAGDLDAHDFYATEAGEYVFLKADREEPEPVPVEMISNPGYRDLPTVLVSPAAVTERGWHAARDGWLLDADRPLTGAERAAARDLAAATGTRVETRESQAALGTTRAIATAMGMLLALGILSMTVGLIRSEAASDLRTLTATGASRWARRTLTGVTAAVLAGLGALLGVTGAYLALTGALWSDLHELRSVPWRELAVTVIGVPVVAGIGGWLLSGREPAGIGGASSG